MLPKGILFDLDDTILAYSEISKPIWHSPVQPGNPIGEDTPSGSEQPTLASNLVLNRYTVGQYGSQEISVPESFTGLRAIPVSFL